MNNYIQNFERTQNNYPKDLVYAAAPTHNFNGKLTNTEIKYSSSQAPKSIRTIDGAIVVESVDEKTRNAAIHFFSNIKEEAAIVSEKYKIEFYKGIAVTVVGIGVGIASLCCIPVLPIAVPIIGGVLAVTVSPLGIHTAVVNHSAMDAVNQDIESFEKKKGQWKDPVDEIIAQRKQIGVGGFQYVFKNHLKGKAVHSQEVQQLWLQDFAKLLSGQHNLRKVCEDNLLGDERIAYAWERSQLPDLQIAGRHFPASVLYDLKSQVNACRLSFFNFEKAIDKELTALNNQKQNLKNEIQNIRTRWLFPSEYMYTQNKREARHLCDNALKPYLDEKNSAIEKMRLSYNYTLPHPHTQEELEYKNQLERLCTEEISRINSQYDNHPTVVNIHRAYDRDSRMCTFLYTQSQLVVNSFFDTRIRQLEAAYNNAKTKIEEQRDKGHLILKDTMDKILSNAENPLNYINTTTPEVLRKWSLPQLSLEPSWNEVYGQLPGFQTQFSSDVSEFAWNLFWGNNGLGRFSSFPTSSWSTLDNNVFGFKPQWFDLHNLQHDRRDYAHTARTEMFAREVRVPQPPVKRAAPMHEPTHQKAHVMPGTREKHHPVGERTGFAKSRQPFNQPPKTPRNEHEKHVRPGTRTAHARSEVR